MEADLKTVHALLRDLEKFLKWIQEAEATVNVLADALQREPTTPVSGPGRKLKKQIEVRGWLILYVRIFSMFLDLKW